MAQEMFAIMGILAALAVGVASPGPSFLLIARVAVATSRTQALGAALGMGVGGVVFGAAALLGLQSVLHAIPALYVALKVLGGMYLCYLGALVFKSAAQPLSIHAAVQDGRNVRRSFWLGFATQVSNPKTAIVYASVFAAFLPKHFYGSFATLLLALVFLVETCWYALVAFVLSSSVPQKVYLSAKEWIDRVAGLVMFGLGLKLIASASRP